MSATCRAILIMGPPGSGKGTQGRALAALPGFFYTAAGDIFRGLDRQTALGQTVAGYMKRGELVPDELTVQVWADHLAAQRRTGRFDPDRDLIILDGIPRSRSQAQLLEAHVRMLRVLHLACDDPRVLMKRLHRRGEAEHRDDDADDAVIRHRLEVYEAQTQPLLDHYPPAAIGRIDAALSPLRVLQQVVAALVDVA